jgi:2,4-dienoyl-CoA reductase-like NADH-dependent reductase (Old Yellow Enzyme family)
MAARSRRVRFPAEVASGAQALPPGCGIRPSPTSRQHRISWPGGRGGARICATGLGRHIYPCICEPRYRGAGIRDATTCLSARRAPNAGYRLRHARGSDKAERLLSESQADLVALSRVAFADPDWPKGSSAGAPLPFDYGALEPDRRSSCARLAERKRLQMAGCGVRFAQFLRLTGGPFHLLQGETP